MATRNIGGPDKARIDQAKQDAFNLRQRLAEAKGKPVYAVPDQGGDTGPVDNSAYTNYQQMMNDLQSQIAANDKIASGFNPDGTPMNPGMKSIIDENGNLISDFEYKAKTIDPATLEGYQAFRKQALQEGPSDWAKLMQQQNLMGKQDAVDAAQRAASTGQAQAMSQMAMRGGFGSGARTSLARQGLKSLMDQRQGAQRDYTGNQLKVGIQDDARKQDALGKFASAEMNLGQYNTDTTNKAGQFNLTNRLGALDKENAYGMDIYKEQLDKWSAEKQADATRKAGGGGGKK